MLKLVQYRLIFLRGGGGCTQASTITVKYITQIVNFEGVCHKSKHVRLVRVLTFETKKTLGRAREKVKIILLSAHAVFSSCSPIPETHFGKV